MLKIIISPAKKMEECLDIFMAESSPQYLDRTRILYEKLKAMSEAELQKLFKANDQITRQNYERFQTMELERAHTPALLSYVGIQYQYIAPQLFSYDQWEYVKEHLRILSGFYGILRPEDRVTPYRLEMQAKLAIEKSKDLYGFWGKSLMDALVTESGTEQAKTEAKPQAESEAISGPRKVILNLASKEYSKAIEKYLTPDIRYVTCMFGVVKDGQVKVKATEAKMARGEMVRFMAERQIKEVERIREFEALGYKFREDLSTEDTYTFVRNEGEPTNRRK